MAEPATAPRPHRTVGVEGGHIAAVCRDLYRRGWMPGTAGNVSVRLDAQVLISASGRPKGAMSRRDTVAVDPADGHPLVGESERPSAETDIHLAVYRKVPEAHAVVHAHGPYATVAAARAGAHETQRGLPVGEWELAKGLGVPDPGSAVIPVFPNWADVSRIGRDIERFLSNAATAAGAPPVLLISRHGATTWGRDLTEAINRLECVEMLCRLMVMTTDGTALGKEGRG